MSSSEGRPSAFTRVRRLAERGLYDRAVIHQILDAATHCHVAHVVAGRPVATPTLHWRVGDTVYWHGSVASRMLRANAAGGEVCLTATIFEAWVLARSAFNHTANYRSVMCFGRPRSVEDPAAKLAALEHLTEHWFPGRWAQLRPATRRELGATRVMAMPIDAASAKVRRGGPEDPAKDRDWPVWAGSVPLKLVVGRPLADAGLSARARRPRLRRPHG
jgi:nitroimidazol reductase NimA-like FMN-containing flavoprotein (pyridoxamine 5'-phosphate oxidase superfamily)